MSSSRSPSAPSAGSERGQLAFFASVVGLDDPVYTDLPAAQAAGYPDLLVPPTFLFSLELRQPNRGQAVTQLGIDPRSILHGEQSFEYAEQIFAGQPLRFAATYADYYEKKGGALKFLVRRTDVTRDGAAVATLTNVLVSRRLEGLEK